MTNGRRVALSSGGVPRLERLRRKISAGATMLAALASCAQDRAVDQAPPVYDADVRPIFERRCIGCHAETSPAGGWRATSFLDAIACVTPSGAPATLPADDRAPILAALDSETHRNAIEPAERAVLAAWVAGATPAFRGAVHSPGIVDPRSPAWHGTLLRASRYRPMLDASDADACGRCHDGALSRPSNVSRAAPGATSCTTCHAEPDGVLACGTCHGAGARSYPPRDPCFFAGDERRAGAHAAHVEPSPTHVGGFACSTCHPPPGNDVIAGLHANGSVEVVFDGTLAGPEVSYDRSTGNCAVSCHNRGGSRPRPAWNDDMPMRCGDCHASPPANHFRGKCSTCHRESDATGASLVGGPLHMNGRVDVGDGSGKCGACHGQGDDPWPSTAAHASHHAPSLAAPIACTTCHAVPPAVVSAGHLDGIVQVALTGHALDRGASPTWNGQTCAEVACHGAKLVDPPSVIPSWTDASGAARACGACHGIPPTQHTASTSCDRSTCHGTEVDRSLTGLAISETGKAIHIDGVIEP